MAEASRFTPGILSLPNRASTAIAARKRDMILKITLQAETREIRPLLDPRQGVLREPRAETRQKRPARTIAAQFHLVAEPRLQDRLQVPHGGLKVTLFRTDPLK